MADAEARSREAAEAERAARSKEDEERKALKDEIASVEEELRRIMAMQTQMQQETAGVAAPVTTTFRPRAQFFGRRTDWGTPKFNIRSPKHEG